MEPMDIKERAKLKKDYPESITLSNTKKSGAEIVHREIFETVFGEQKW